MLGRRVLSIQSGRFHLLTQVRALEVPFYACLLLARKIIAVILTFAHVGRELLARVSLEQTVASSACLFPLKLFKHS